MRSASPISIDQQVDKEWMMMKMTTTKMMIRTTTAAVAHAPCLTMAESRPPLITSIKTTWRWKTNMWLPTRPLPLLLLRRRCWPPTLRFLLQLLLRPRTLQPLVWMKKSNSTTNNNSNKNNTSLWLVLQRPQPHHHRQRHRTLWMKKVTATTQL